MYKLSKLSKINLKKQCINEQMAAVDYYFIITQNLMINLFFLPEDFGHAIPSEFFDSLFGTVIIFFLIKALFDIKTFFEFILLKKNKENENLLEFQKKNKEKLAEYADYVEQMCLMLEKSTNLQVPKNLSIFRRKLRTFSSTFERIKIHEERDQIENSLNIQILEKLLEDKLLREFWALEGGILFGYKTVVSDEKTYQKYLKESKTNLRPDDKNKEILKMVNQEMSCNKDTSTYAHILTAEKEFQKNFNPFYIEENGTDSDFLRNINLEERYIYQKYPARFINIFKFSGDEAYPSLKGIYFFTKKLIFFLINRNH